MQLLRPIRAVCRAPLADAGFTLIETIIAVGLALLVLWPVSTVLLNTQQASSGTIQRADAIQTAQVGLRSMDQQLRNAYEVEFPTQSASCSSPWCTAISSGVQYANVVDVLTHSSNSVNTTTPDSEIRFDCTQPSPTITGDRACYEYICTASYSTGSGSSCTSSGHLVIDDLTNATNSQAGAVFAFCYPTSGTSGGCATPPTGASRPSSAIVTIDVPAAGTLSTHTQNGDPTTVQLTDTVYMQNLDSNYDS
jgi:Tfp pilus assembly protein PilX